LRETADDGIENRDAWHFQCCAMAFEELTKFWIDKSEEDDPRLPLDVGEDALKLLGGSDEGVDVLNRAILRIMCRRGAGDRIEGLAGRIGDQVHVEIAMIVRHEM
jgi:hypothetical protein